MLLATRFGVTLAVTTRSSQRKETTPERVSAIHRTAAPCVSVPALMAWTFAKTKSAKLVRWTRFHERLDIRRIIIDVASTATSR